MFSTVVFVFVLFFCASVMGARINKGVKTKLDVVFVVIMFINCLIATVGLLHGR